MVADGRWIAYISDQSGEDEIYIKNQDGTGEAKQLTRDADTYKYQIYWSPDGEEDHLERQEAPRLFFVDVEIQAGHGSRQRPALGNSELCLVARQPLGRLRPTRSRRHAPDLSLFARIEKDRSL